MLAPRVLAFIQGHRMVREGDRLLVGVSGGPDSLCLLRCLLELRERLGIDLHVAHLDHALRPDSPDDAQYVAGLAADWGLPCTLERQPVLEFRARHRISLEEAARQVRYAFFGRLARELGAVGVAVGHTADDQVETILLHWLRGSGLAGLRGMQPVTAFRSPFLGERVTVLRPLLEVSRAEAEAYCQALGLQPRVDPSNLSPRYLRNRLRLRLLPVLETYNPHIRQVLLRMARNLGQDYAFIEGEVRRLWPEIAREEPGLVAVDVAKATALPVSLLNHLLRSAVERVLGDLAGIELVNVEQMAAALGKPPGTLLHLPRGLVFSVGYGSCTLSWKEVPCPLPAILGEHPLRVPGETAIPGWRITAVVEERAEPLELGGSPWVAYLDGDRAGDRLWVRARCRGDRFQPLGMAQEKRLQDFLVDARVPRAWRDRVPLVVSPGQIAWVAGWRIDERVKVTEATRRVLRLRFTPVAEACAQVCP